MSAAALESGRFTPESVLPGPATYTLPGTSTVMRNDFSGACGPNGEVTLAEALAISCNTAFAWLGVQLGDDALREQAEKFGFDTSFDVPMTAAAGRFPEDPDPAQTALSSIGQFDVRATAFNMAMVAASVANSGVTMYPDLVSSISAPDLRTLETLQPRTFAQAMSAENAAELTEMMVGVVSGGTGSNARIPGVAVAGKTGTAETGHRRTEHGLVHLVRPRRQPAGRGRGRRSRMPEPSDVSGNGLAAPIARSVMEAILNK